MNSTMRKNLKKYKKIFDFPDLTIKSSKRNNKRFQASYTDYDGNRQTVYFGQPGAFTFADGAPEAKRRSYRARAKEQRIKNGHRAISVPGSPASLAYYILW
ncbi:hypothetical protein QLL95_gp0956 [Cotonvirus japonicus]|uniref:Uncharacterized protein n=1 Tax=Cotonvirus japonicus TaxID=2811091 RepID=A0ABM7NSV4_9VIRU|nr:hypothetical protein QLL95_gp0956 [Cotonvirus japonicus]BCS83167.1 hypothetical protein [Cotonvirus japonicus]